MVAAFEAQAAFRGECFRESEVGELSMVVQTLAQMPDFVEILHRKFGLSHGNAGSEECEGHAHVFLRILVQGTRGLFIQPKNRA